MKSCNTTYLSSLFKWYQTSVSQKKNVSELMRTFVWTRFSTPPPFLILHFYRKLTKLAIGQNKIGRSWWLFEVWGVTLLNTDNGSKVIISQKIITKKKKGKKKHMPCQVQKFSQALRQYCFSLIKCSSNSYQLGF